VHALNIQKECGFFDSWLLSTESEEVRSVASEAGYRENYTRPEEMSLTKSSVWSAVRHAMRYITEYGGPTDYICLLHPTSPCILPETIEALCENMIELEDVCDAMVAVAYSSTFSWSVAEKPDFSKAKNTQEHVPRHKLTNAFFIAKWDKLLEKKNLYALNWLPYCIDADEAIDIDDEVDFNIAEAILQWRDRNEQEATEPSTRDI
jgi:CMP-N-acetylneuraminic acid synthetase